MLVVYSLFLTLEYFINTCTQKRVKLEITSEIALKNKTVASIETSRVIFLEEGN